MRAADVLVETLIAQGVDLCFTNPGTTEMHLVAALDRHPAMRSVLCLFEGVATGAADGYARIAGKPAATLLHLGPGLANGLANLHNARRAHSPLVNIIGDHARAHRPLDPPLASDIAGMAAPVSRWVETVAAPDEAAEKAVAAVRAAYGPPAGVASLILPADCAWEEVASPPLDKQELPGLEPVSESAIAAAAEAFRTATAPVLFLGGPALSETGLKAAGRITAATGARLVMETFPARVARGAGRVSAVRLNYFAEGAAGDLRGADLMLLAGARAPISFFAYPGKPASFVPDGAKLHEFGTVADDLAPALGALADALGAPADPPLAPRATAPAIGNPEAKLNAAQVGLSLLRHLKDGAIICDDSTTSGLGVYSWLENGPDHDWLCLTGGAIGLGMPLAVGAALAAPDRPVISLNGDGAAAYTLQALWTQAREGQKIVNIVFANNSYLILNVELAKLGDGPPGAIARRMLSLDAPRLDWVKLAQGFGLEATRATTVGTFDAALEAALEADGPQLIVAGI
ncbi:MAG: acetolactate synthase large subunit [Rhodothalassiaceae bacterium]